MESIPGLHKRLKIRALLFAPSLDDFKSRPLGESLLQTKDGTLLSAPLPEIRHTLDPPLLSLLVVPLVRELRSTRSCDFLNRGGGFIKGILRGVRCTKSLRVFFLLFYSENRIMVRIYKNN